MTGVISGESTVDEAKEWLRAEALGAGAPCPVCTQMARVYRRKLTAPTAAVLIAMYRLAGSDWVNVPRLEATEKGGDALKARYWGLIEQQPGERGDGSWRTGWWRLTPDGVGFVLGSWSIPKYALIYDGKCLGLEGEKVDVREALSTKFSYADLMAGV